MRRTAYRSSLREIDEVTANVKPVPGTFGRWEHLQRSGTPQIGAVHAHTVGDACQNEDRGNGRESDAIRTGKFETPEQDQEDQREHQHIRRRDHYYPQRELGGYILHRDQVRSEQR